MLTIKQKHKYRFWILTNQGWQWMYYWSFPDDYYGKLHIDGTIGRWHGWRRYSSLIKLLRIATAFNKHIIINLIN